MQIHNIKISTYKYIWSYLAIGQLDKDKKGRCAINLLDITKTYKNKLWYVKLI